jgi:hypothetical protein
MLASHDYRRLMNSVIESQEIVGIWKGLRSLNDSGLADDLKRVPRGQMMLRDETADRGGNQARNDSFQLYLKSIFVRASFAVTPHPRCDITFNHGGQEYAMECKRPLKENGVEESFEKAIRQLRDHYKEDWARKGFIAISASRVINDGTKIIQADMPEEMNAKTAWVVRDFYDRHSHLVFKIKEPETIGVIVHLKAPVMLGKRIMLSDTFLFDPFRSEGKGIVAVMQSKISAIAL